MAVVETAGEDIGIRRKRLRYRAWHRGMREMDLMLGPFADAHVEGYGAGELDRLEAFMEEQDTDLLTWVLGQATAPAHIDHELLGMVLSDYQRRLGK